MLGQIFAWSERSLSGLAIVVFYPVLAIALLELARHLAARRKIVSELLMQVVDLLLPAGALWLILRRLAELPETDWGVRVAETATALTALYLVLRVAQALLTALMDEDARAPKLLLDLVRIGLSLVWGVVVISRIWDVDLGSLFAAMGVGSIVLGFALQEFLGNLLSGLGLLSAHKFGLGDWIVVDGAAGQVVEMDWRTVTLVKAGGVRVVVANSTLAKGNLVISARANMASTILIPLNFGLDIPPEQVRDAVREAARGMPGVSDAGGVRCTVSSVNDIAGGTGGAITYTVRLPVPSPGAVRTPRDEFLSRFWYVAQRRGLRLRTDAADAGSAEADAAARLHMVQQFAAFRNAAEVLPVLARDSILRRYRKGEVLLAQGAPAADALFVVAGTLAVQAVAGAALVRLELVPHGQVFVLHETLTGGTTPVQLVADQATDVLAVPAAALLAVMQDNPALARDITAMAEARRLALHRHVRLRPVG